jgi:hypothetical protein
MSKDIFDKDDEIIEEKDLNIIFKIAGVVSGTLIAVSISLTVCCYYDEPFHFIPVFISAIIGALAGTKISDFVDKFI